MAKNGAVYKASGSLPKIISGIIIIAAIVGGAMAFLTMHRSPTARGTTGITTSAKSGNSLVPATTLAPTKKGGSRYRPKNSSTTSTASSGQKSTTSTTGIISSKQFSVITISPTPGATGIDPLTPIILTFSQPLSQNSATPTITPSTAGTWKIQNNEAIFTPTIPFIPLSDVTVTAKNSLPPIMSTQGATLSSTFTSNFRIKTGSVLRIQELMSILKYSPLAFRYSGPPLSNSDEAAQLAAFYNPPAGKFIWRQTTWPTELTQLWQAGTYDTMTKGLVMEFQADHGLLVNGRRTAGLFNDLLQAVLNHQINTGGYNYGLVNKTPPENLTIWHNGHVVIKTPANTGIAADPTIDGTYPVFAKYRYQVMHGTNPNGSHYSDPVQFVSYFNGGEAVHYMPRTDYGIPQSLGCVELPLTEASQVWPWLAYGTLVTVIN